MQTAAVDAPRCRRHLLGFDIRHMDRREHDVLVIGSGLAGLMTALVAADAGADVFLATKGRLAESNSHYAQGGIAAVLPAGERDPEDSAERHVADTLAAGAGLCDADVARRVVDRGAEAIAFLRERGCRFDVDDADAGHAALTREGGHSRRRILHAAGDNTGREVTECLIAAVAAHPRITAVGHCFVVDLLTDDHGVCGVLSYRKGELRALLAGATVLATGGCGMAFRETTNPEVATGDGLAMAYRAGTRIADAEFVQFHPTALYIAGAARILITEAMRGEGAVLKNAAGEAFMGRYHELGDLAPRDVVSRAIVTEVKGQLLPHVWLDATAFDDDFLARRFPSISGACREFNLDIRRDWIPVFPSAHYHCGGILAAIDGSTDLPGLRAVGEVACTGLHGANRLASNSILEALVMGLACGRDLAGSEARVPRPRPAAPAGDAAPDTLDLADLTRSLRALMWKHVGIERRGGPLAMARRSCDFWLAHQAGGAFDRPAGWRLQNLLTVGLLIATAAERRAASCGTHYRTDGEDEPDPVHHTLRNPGAAGP